MTKVYNKFVEIAYEVRCFNLTIKFVITYDISKLFPKCFISDTHSMSVPFNVTYS